MISPHDLETLRQGAQLYIMRGLTNYTISPSLLLELLDTYEDHEGDLEDTRLEAWEQADARTRELEDELEQAEEAASALQERVAELEEHVKAISGSRT